MLCSNLKIIRKNKGYSQEELAEKIHVTRQTISKWENGQSVPDAEIIKSIAEVLDISVSDLIEGDAEKIIENEVIIDQLARLNEQLIINNRKMKNQNRSVVFAGVALVLVVALIAGGFALKQRRERGYRIAGPEHLGVLTYTIPYKVFYHAENGVGVTHERDGRQRISAKSYRNYDDMSEIVIWNEGEYNLERIDEFKAKYSGAEENAELEHGCLPEGTEYFISATDGGVDPDGLYHMGSYYRAYIVLDGRMYEVEVTNGDAPAEYGEFVISSMAVNDTLQEEYWEGSIYN